MSAAGFDGGSCQNAHLFQCYIKSLLKIGNEENILKKIGGGLNYCSSKQVLLSAVHIETEVAFDPFATSDGCGFLFTQLQMAAHYKANNFLTTSHVFDRAKMLKHINTIIPKRDLQHQVTYSIPEFYSGGRLYIVSQQDCQFQYCQPHERERHHYSGTPDV